MRGTATNDGADDDGTAGVAGLARTPKDLDVHVLAALPALPIDVVLEARAPVLDPAFEDGAAGSEEPLRGLRRDFACRGIRPDASFEESFVDIDVAETREPPLVQEHGLHRSGAASEALAKHGERQRIIDWLGAELIDDLGGGFVDPPRAELAEVGPAEVVAVIELDDGALPLFGRGGAFSPDEAASHAQVHDEHSAIVEREHEVLPAPAEGRDGAADEVGAKHFDWSAGEKLDSAPDRHRRP